MIDDNSWGDWKNYTVEEKLETLKRLLETTRRQIEENHKVVCKTLVELEAKIKN